MSASANYSSAATAAGLAIAAVAQRELSSFKDSGHLSPSLTKT